MSSSYAKFSKEQLISKITELEKLIEMNGISLAGNCLTKQSSSDSPTISNKAKRGKSNFDFDKYSTRSVAFKVAYFGWAYRGVAYQGPEISTVEKHFFAALLKARLIKDIESCNFSRCGRTDTGVSSFSQIFALKVRSNLPAEKQNDPVECSTKEFPYIHVLNRFLPSDIKILAMSFTKPEFSARQNDLFDCKYRLYKYYFMNVDGKLNIEIMKLAASKFLGVHNFKNYCKIDKTKEFINFERNIMEINISPCSFESVCNRFQFFEFTVKGTAFLYHQIRCMLGVLFLVGEGKEEPSIISDLFDIENFPEKPSYEMASEIPLILYDCGYDPKDVVFEDCRDEEKIRISKESLEPLFTEHFTKHLMLQDLMSQIMKTALATGSQQRTVKYTKFLDRIK